MAEEFTQKQVGRVVKLDRGFPLVRLESGEEVRCEHAISLVKGSDQRAVIGDFVEVLLPEGHDKGIIEKRFRALHVSCEKTQPNVLFPKHLRQTLIWYWWLSPLKR